MTIQTSKMFLMTVRKLSAFTPCRNKNNNLGSLNKLRDLQKFAINFTTMGSWKNEKQKYLSMSVEERRKNYKDYVKWEDIPTWKEYATKEQSKLAKKIDIKSDYVINPAQHAELCDKVSIFLGDITTLEIDAIVNAANNTLLGGGGVDGAIHRRAGSLLLEECRTLNGCETGEAKITGGYKLPAKYVIHTVGPRGEKPDYLKNSYNNCLNLLVENKLRSIAFPCISTGIYGYPVEAAAHVSVYTVRKQLEQRSQDIDRVVFCLFSDEDKTVYEGVLQSYFPVN